LLGFVEGDGSFNVNKSANYSLGFNITQSSRDLHLMGKIKAFLLILPGASDDVVYLYSKSSAPHLPFKNVYLSIHKRGFFNKVLIPFFDSMV
jgi:hypothetical protein